MFLALQHKDESSQLHPLQKIATLSLFTALWASQYLHEADEVGSGGRGLVIWGSVGVVARALLHQSSDCESTGRCRV